MPHRSLIAAFAAATLTLCAPLASAVAQPAQPDSGQNNQQTLAGVMARADELPAPRRLGVRSRVLASAAVEVPTVVLVEHPADAARAIGAWRGFVRYPVLIDDGTPASADAIGRFVRAFEPETIVRWSSGEGDWSGDAQAVRSQIVAALARVFGVETEEPTIGPGLIGPLVEAGATPHGIVMVDASDPAWVAGLALAAGRQQAIGFTSSVGRVNGSVPEDRLAQQRTDTATALGLYGLDWRGLGSGVDALTLAMNTASKVRAPDAPRIQNREALLALTDAIVRDGDHAGPRWAWGGMIFGSARVALERAMASLFGVHRAAWVFDGYPDNPPWSAYDGTEAAELLRQAGVAASLADSPANGIDDWRRIASRGVDAELALINTKGNPDFFELGSGQGRPGDAPLLARPTAVIMVHSWSLASPANIGTVGGRWLARGASAFYGSVQEPTLGAFVPTPAVVRRLIGTYPLGAAVRFDDGPAGRLNLMGDPLVTLTPERLGRRAEPGVPLDGARPVRDDLEAALRAERFAEGLGLLAMSARDAEAARLVRALLDSRPEAVTPGVAAAALTACYHAAGRLGDWSLVLDLFERLDVSDRENALLVDALWHAARAAADDTDQQGRWDAVLRTNLRDGQALEDAFEVARRMARRGEGASAAAWLGSKRDLARGDQQRRRLNSVIEEVNAAAGPR